MAGQVAGQPLDVFLARDDADAKARVAQDDCLKRMAAPKCTGGHALGLPQCTFHVSWRPAVLRRGEASRRLDRPPHRRRLTRLTRRIAACGEPAVGGAEAR